MGSPERSFGEKNGTRIRSVGMALFVLGLFESALIIPSLGIIAGGEILRRTSENKND